MNFNSGTFAVFMLVVGFLYLLTQWGTARRGPQNFMLLAASYWFYGSWDRQFLFLILISTACDYVCGLAMRDRRPPARAAWSMGVALLIAAGLLCAPINWAGVFAVVLPDWCWQGGWVLKPAVESLVLPGGTWTHALTAMGATLALASVLGAGYLIAPRHRRRYFLVTSMVSNLALLGFFKYCDFFLEGLSTLLHTLGLGDHTLALGIIVPVGISFYTFQTMSYTIDVYRGELEPTENLLDFSLFVAFFPQLVAGPIERAVELLPQFQHKRALTWNQWRSGWFLIGWGLFKKIFIADNMIPLVNLAFHHSDTATGPMVWLSTLAFAMQIYCDFSAYSDIARGVARLMSVELMVNFNLPYFAVNPKEFWARWHISLSTWLRDYLYIPLGGNRGRATMVYRNLMLTMVLGGLWHGARANFVWWGVYQGVLLCIHRLLQPWLKKISPQHGWPRVVVTGVCWLGFMQLVGYGWLLFRADSNLQIAQLSGALLTGWGNIGPQMDTLLAVMGKLAFYCLPLLAVQVCQYHTGNLLVVLTWPWALRTALYVVLFYLVIVFGAFDVVQFIYFQF